MSRYQSHWRWRMFLWHSNHDIIAHLPVRTTTMPHPEPHRVYRRSRAVSVHATRIPVASYLQVLVDLGSTATSPIWILGTGARVRAVVGRNSDWRRRVGGIAHPDMGNMLTHHTSVKIRDRYGKQRRFCSPKQQLCPVRATKIQERRGLSTIRRYRRQAHRVLVRP